MIVRRWLTVLVAALSLVLVPTAARALWSASAVGTTSVAATTMRNASALTASCTSAAPDSTVTLTWSPSPDAFVGGYQLVRTDSPGGAQTTWTAAAGTTQTDAPPVGAGRSYTYAIQATSGAWRTPWLAADAAPAYTADGCSPAPAPAPAPSSLMSAASFSARGGAGEVTSTGATPVSGDVGVADEQTVVGFPTGEASGTGQVGDAAADQAHQDRAAADDEAEAEQPRASSPET
ncbi:MAG: hypothetical protein JWN88_1627 [Frankiales bacterium]|nr:hypothetical protein [Frankiales bacterium]